MIGVGMFWDGYEGGWARPVIERKLIHDYLTWADAAGREVPAFDRDDYRESFGRGFIEQICDRLEAMRARSASQETVSGTRFELRDPGHRTAGLERRARIVPRRSASRGGLSMQRVLAGSEDGERWLYGHL